LTGMIIQDDSLKLVGDELTTEPYGAGIPNDEPEYADFVSGVVEDTFESGEWAELYEEWVGQYTGQEAEPPTDVTLEDALELFPCVEFC
ncbi:MAG TPA: transporter substrate-binding domain-containing protein, partial [Actinomycetota bacterium]|nr:transporter substrate-binding domain-containing protein [Actinomycetota bacterium]